MKTAASSAAASLGATWDDAMAAPCDSALPHAPQQDALAPPITFEPLKQVTAAAWQSKSEHKPSATGRDSVQFVIPGVPIAKGRPRFARQGAFVRAFTPAATVNFENMVRLVAAETMAEAGRAKLGGPLELRITAVFPIPASWSKKKRSDANWHVSRPDATNLVKAIEDACNEVVWTDDSQVARLVVEKRYGETPRTVVWVHRMEEA